MAVAIERLSDSARTVLVILHAAESVTIPRVDRLARLAGRTRSQVQEAMQELERDGRLGSRRGDADTR